MLADLGVGAYVCTHWPVTHALAGLAWLAIADNGCNFATINLILLPCPQFMTEPSTSGLSKIIFFQVVAPLFN